MRQKLILIVGSLLLTFIVLELGTRIFVGIEKIPEIERMRLDPALGWRWTPNYEKETTYRDHHYHLKISSQGLRNELITLPKPSNHQRFMALGDSITAGLGVELEETFAKRLQDSLGVEVINAGVDDYGLEQESLWLEQTGITLEPDVVILEVYLNDSRPFSKPARWVAIFNNLLINRSAFYTYYYRVMVQLRADKLVEASDSRFRYITPWETGAWKTDPRILKQVLDGGSNDFGLAWQWSENEKLQRGIGKIANLSQQDNFELLVVIFPVSIQVETEVDLPEINRPQQWLVDYMEDNGIEYLDLLPVLRQYAHEGLYIDHAHLTPHGHIVVANAIREKLAQ